MLFRGFPPKLLAGAFYPLIIVVSGGEGSRQDYAVIFVPLLLRRWIVKLLYSIDANAHSPTFIKILQGFTNEIQKESSSVLGGAVRRLVFAPKHGKSEAARRGVAILTRSNGPFENRTGWRGGIMLQS